MILRTSQRLCPRLSLVAVCGFVGLIVGCESGTKLRPVEGVVTVADKPLNTGAVTFKPDTAKGNTFPGEPTGRIDEQGHYSITTNGKPGAPAGWYKVIVPASVPLNPKDPYSMPRWLVAQKYIDEKQTPLAVEVVPSPAPGAYDLKLQP